MAIQEGLKTAEVDLTSPSQMNRVLVTAGTGLSLLALFGIKVDGNPIVISMEALARPENFSKKGSVEATKVYSPSKFVSIPYP